MEHPRDVIVRITASGICKSDLHLPNGLIPTMKTGDVLGHEPRGIVVEVGSQVPNLSVGDRVFVPFTIACGQCFFCKLQQLTNGRGPERCIDAVGCEAPASSTLVSMVDAITTSRKSDGR